MTPFLNIYNILFFTCINISLYPIIIYTNIYYNHKTKEKISIILITYTFLYTTILFWHPLKYKSLIKSHLFFEIYIIIISIIFDIIISIIFDIIYLVNSSFCNEFISLLFLFRFCTLGLYCIYRKKWTMKNTCLWS